MNNVEDINRRIARAKHRLKTLQKMNAPREVIKNEEAFIERLKQTKTQQQN